MSDGRRLADDGNSSIRTMKTSSDRKLMEIFIFNTMSGVVGWCDGVIPNNQTLEIKTQYWNAFNANGCVRLVCPVNKKSLIHTLHT